MCQFTLNLFPYESNIFLIEFGVQVEFMIMFINTELTPDTFVAHFTNTDYVFR